MKATLSDIYNDFIMSKEVFSFANVNGKELKCLIVSTYGRVFKVNVVNEKILVRSVPSFINKGHAYINLHAKGFPKHLQVHRLVAMTFIPNPSNKPQVHHINKNPLDNCVNNLMWVTEKEHSDLHPELRNIHRDVPIGEKCNLSVYSEKQVIDVCKLLEENKKTYSEISALTGMKIHAISKIRNKKNWVVISKNFDIDNYDTKPSKSWKNNHGEHLSKYTVDQLKEVCSLLEKGCSTKDIMSKTSVSVDVIGDLRRRERYSYITKDYRY